MKKSKIFVENSEISITEQNEQDFISLTDIAKHKDKERADYILQNWMRNRGTIEFLGLWEEINNENFNSIEFDGFKNNAGSNSFSMTPKRWILSTNAIGIKSKAGRYGGTFAHKDIAFEFASWISPKFKLYLIKEFQRLKDIEIKKEQLGWDLKRNLAKVNYKIHTDAIKENLPKRLSGKEITFIYATEADILNKSLFGFTAKEWRNKNKGKDGNVRDYATIEQLIVLSNLESINAELIRQSLSQKERLVTLNNIAISQMKSLLGQTKIKEIKR